MVQKQFLKDEEAVIGMLKESYKQSLRDITQKAEKLHGEIEAMTAELDFIEDDDEREIQKSKIRSKVYQKKYQDSLSGQVGDILDKMQKEEFKTVSEYLGRCYEDGFAGTLYDLQGQGIPLAFPLDQEAMVRAVQIDSKISQGLYTRLGEDVAVLKKKIASDVTRGIASGMSFKQVAQQLSGKTNIGFNNAVRIARTEGHRIQVQGTMDACYTAKEKGADVVKQWDSTLDARTRDSHAKVDGEIKELDEKFSNGLMFPGDPSGGAAEVVNCRCALLQRARWAVGGGFTKMNNFTKQLETFESPEDYADFKKGFFSDENRQYMNYVQEMENKYKTKDFRTILDKMDDREYKHYTKLTENNPIFNKNALTNSVNSGKMPTEMLVPDIKDTRIKKSVGNFQDVLQNSNGVKAHTAKMSMYTEYTEYVEKNDCPSPFRYSFDDDVIFYNPKAPHFFDYDMNFVQAHEITHRMDFLEYKSFNNAKFNDAIKICQSKVLERADEIQEWFADGGKYENSLAMSDIISALSNNKIAVPVGHKNDYWENRANVSAEVFANISTIDVLGYEEKAEFESLLKELFDAYRGIVS